MNDEKNDKKIMNIYPIKKGRRMLVFLGDFFVNFMLSFLLFAVACLPLGKVFTKYNDKNNEYTNNLNLRADILYENQILFNSKNVDSSEIIYNTSFTYYVYLSYFAYDEASPEHVEYIQYGHKTENNIFNHYFLDILGNSETYYSLFDKYNSKYSYFIRTDSTIELPTEYKNEIVTFFDTSDKPTAECKKMMNRIEKSVFYPMLSEVMTLIEKNDLLNSSGDSYIKTSANIKAFEKYIDNLAIGTGLSAYFISTSLLYLLIPLINKGHKTATMFVLKVERIDINSLRISSKGKTILIYIYSLFLSLLISFFVPIGLLTIFEIFNISLLFVLALFSIFLIIASFAFLLFNSFNRSLFDYFTGTIMVTSDTLDEIYRSRGYYI